MEPLAGAGLEGVGSHEKVLGERLDQGDLIGFDGISPSNRDFFWGIPCGINRQEDRYWDFGGIAPLTKKI